MCSLLQESPLASGIIDSNWTLLRPSNASSVCIIFRDVLLSSKVEEDLDGEEILDLDFQADEIVTQADDFSWDQLVLDGNEDNVA